MAPAGPGEARAPAAIARSRVLLVEGKAACYFFIALLRTLGRLDSIEIRDFGGNGDLRTYLGTLVITSGWEQVVSLGIVRDAETDATAAFRSICSALRRVGLSVPEAPMCPSLGTPITSVYILPDCVSPGMLETLCLKSVVNDPAMPCVIQLFDCLAGCGIALPANLAKAHAHAFISTRPKPELLVGQAAQAGYWPWDNPAFDILKAFLLSI